MFVIVRKACAETLFEILAKVWTKNIYPHIKFFKDINECAEDSNLCQNGQCMNKDGGYWCKCNPGFEPNEDMTKCEGNKFIKRKFFIKTQHKNNLLHKTPVNISATQRNVRACAYKRRRRLLQKQFAMMSVAVAVTEPDGATDRFKNTRIS